MKTVVISGLCSFILFSSCHSPEQPETEEYVEFYKVDETNLISGDAWSAQADHRKIEDAVRREKAKLTAVLVYYGIPVRYTSEGKITVPKSNTEDADYLFELVRKSKDTTWYKNHIVSESYHN